MINYIFHLIHSNYEFQEHIAILLFQFTLFHNHALFSGIWQPFQEPCLIAEILIYQICMRCYSIICFKLKYQVCVPLLEG